MKTTILFLVLTMSLALAFSPRAFATVHYDPSSKWIFTLPAYGTGIGFSVSETFTDCHRTGNFWYFDGTEFSTQVGNLTVDDLFTGNFVNGTVYASSGDLVTVSLMKPTLTTTPVTVTVAGANVSSAADSASFLAATSTIWFWDSSSLRCYLKVKLTGSSAIFSVDYNAPPVGPSGGGSGGGASNPSVTVGDVYVSGSSGHVADAALALSWNLGSLTLTGLTFSGAYANWVLAGVSVPVVLTVDNRSVPLTVTVPEGAADGQYVVNVVSAYSGSYGSGSVKSRVIVTVGAAVAGWTDQAWAWALANETLLLLSFAGVAALVTVGAVARTKRR